MNTDFITCPNCTEIEGAIIPCPTHRRNEPNSPTAAFIRSWLLDNYLKKDYPGNAELATCIVSQDLTHLDARIEHYRGMESGDPADGNDAYGFVLTGLVEAHEGPHTATCPDGIKESITEEAEAEKARLLAAEIAHADSKFDGGEFSRVFTHAADPQDEHDSTGGTK